VCSLCILGESGEFLRRGCSDDGCLLVNAIHIDDAIHDACGEDAVVDGSACCPITIQACGVDIETLALIVLPSGRDP
jgi:hypothetical protein